MLLKLYKKTPMCCLASVRAWVRPMPVQKYLWTPFIKPFSSNKEYFNSVLNEDNDNYKNNEVSTAFEQIREQEFFDLERRHALRKVQKEKFGLKDYELSDFAIEGVKEGNTPRTLKHIDPVSQLQPNIQVAVFGLPFDATRKEVLNAAQNYGLVERVELFENVLGDVSHAIVTFKTNTACKRWIEDQNQVWIRDGLLKFRSSSQAEQESVRNRTVVVGNIPPWVSKSAVVDSLIKIGSIVDIDFPTTDLRIQQFKNKKLKPEVEQKLRNTYENQMKISEKYFKRMDEFFMEPENQNKIFDNIQPYSEDYAVPLAERLLNYEQEIRKRVSNKSAVHIEKLNLQRIEGMQVF